LDYKRNNMVFNSTKEYIDSFPPDIQEILEKVRATILKAVPEAEEAMGYGVAAFKLNGKYLIYYAAFKNHIGIYPTPEVIEAFKYELKGYRQSKGTIQFQLDEQIPYDLIERLVKYKAQGIIKNF